LKSNILTNLIVVLLSVGTSFLLYSGLDPIARGVIIVSMLYPQLVNGLLYAGLERLIFARKILIRSTYIFLLMCSLVILVLLLAGILRSEIFSENAFWIMVLGLPIQFAYSFKSLHLFLTGNQSALNWSKLLYQALLTAGATFCLIIGILTPVIYCLMHLVAVFFGLLYVHTCNRKEFFEYKSVEIHYNLITKDFIFPLKYHHLKFL
jgi:hypothetical protein